jgi:TonB family protein
MAKRSEKYHSRLDHDPTTMGFAVLISCLVSCLVTFLLFPPSRRAEDVEETMKRFGYEGPTRYEREIEVRLSDESAAGANRLMGGLQRTDDARQAGEPLPVDDKRRKGRRHEDPGLAGLTASGEDARRLRLMHLPLVQSEDLIAVDLVRPEYPQDAIAHGDTGRVELAGLVDEHGVVQDVMVLHSAGDLLDHAAADAVRRCRFLPYRPKGEVQPVWASFHYHFLLQE